MSTLLHSTHNEESSLQTNLVKLTNLLYNKILDSSIESNTQQINTAYSSIGNSIESSYNSELLSKHLKSFSLDEMSTESNIQVQGQGQDIENNNISFISNDEIDQIIDSRRLSFCSQHVNGNGNGLDGEKPKFIEKMKKITKFSERNSNMMMSLQANNTHQTEFLTEINQNPKNYMESTKPKFCQSMLISHSNASPIMPMPGTQSPSNGLSLSLCLSNDNQGIKTSYEMNSLSSTNQISYNSNPNDDIQDIYNGSTTFRNLDPIILPQSSKGLTSSSTKKSHKKKHHENLLEKNLRKYESSMELMHKYTTSDIIRELNKSPNGQKILTLITTSSKKRQNPIIYSSPRPSPIKYKKLQQIFDQVITIDLNSKNHTNYDQNRIMSIYQYLTEEYHDGNKYEGEKLFGKRHGNGTYYYTEGHKYTGSWKDDKICGFGTLWHNNNNNNIKWYEGEWNENNFHGNGILYNLYPNYEYFDFDGKNFLELNDHWIQYQGGFQKGKKNGFGTLLISNGDIFMGNFINDTIHGRGSYTKSNGETYAGLWECNCLVSCF